MTEGAYMRDSFNRARENPEYICHTRRHVDWMTDEQWRQVCDFCQGKRVLEDPELIYGFANCTEQHSFHRVARWAYSNVSSLVVNHNYHTWSELINSLVDQDLQVDKGL